MKHLLFAALAALMLTGCTNVATFDYAASQGTLARFQAAGAAAKTVAVLPVLDQRSVYNDPEDSGSFYWGFVPLMPIGYLTKPEPEATDDFVSLGRFHFDAVNDLANAEAMSLKASGLFANVKLANNLQQAGNADYLWKGTVTSTYYRGRFFTYGITYFLAPVLWAIGFPSGSSTNELHIQFDLIERATGKAVWHYEFADSDFVVHWLYARIGEDTIWYPRLMKMAMNNALRDLVQKNPGL